MSDRMKPVNLAELRAQFEGTRFCQLVQHHLRRQTQDQRIHGIQGTIALLPEAARGVAEGFIDRWNTRAYDEAFWQRDTGSVFDEIINDARDVLRHFGFASDDEAAFNLFNIVVLSYAYSAYDQPKMREFMRIAADGFPWPSALSLLYPIGATIYIATLTPAGPAMVVGYGLTNLGYLLFGAGIWAGSFRILGLKRRWQVLAAAVAAFGVGTVLSNVGA
jgi:hypothetical protein